MRQINRQAPPPAAQPQTAGRRVRPIGQPADEQAVETPHDRRQTRVGGRRNAVPLDKGGEIAQYGGGGMGSLTPMVDGSEAPEGVAVQSRNLAFGAGGDPQYTVVDEVPPEEDVPPPDRYLVTEEKNVALNGHRFTLRVGKILDTANYDVPRLVAQGAKLKKLEPGAVA